ncbi:MAG: M48 family metallopeptidase [Thermodesulfobacteriota bacterium]|nr:M48 family metallopeptidase [Thermodesulfobacteriota bacterium]
MKYTPRRLKTNVNVTPTSPLKDLVVLVGGLLAIGVGIYVLMGFAVDLIAPRISLGLEKKLAIPFLHTIKKSTTAHKQQPYVQSLIDDLQSRCTDLPYEFKVHIIDSKSVNAAAMPGGHILVYKGLLEQVSSENELVFILAHELGHFAHRDHLRGLGRGLVLLTMSVVLLGSDNLVGDLLSRGVNFTEMGFSRKQEAQADTFGLETLQCAYGHVAGATTFFSKMSKGQDPGRWGHYFASHPENRQRIEHLEQLAKDHGYPTGPLTPLP